MVVVERMAPFLIVLHRRGVLECRRRSLHGRTLIVRTDTEGERTILSKAPAMHHLADHQGIEAMVCIQALADYV
jgi:hypothetical protein